MTRRVYIRKSSRIIKITNNSKKPFFITHKGIFHAVIFQNEEHLFDLDCGWGFFRGSTLRVPEGISIVQY